ncbi:protein MIZU-KUSSEI 1 [Argentina anserina]|uniref:protein MIZU-KUSSEI 1 n=1 Tax=Argentina anserina TaxID=57926 RepID=UPI0021766B6F|nr:protein MIZU-KUSSEI 1 [Potentilla anserina]
MNLQRSNSISTNSSTTRKLVPSNQFTRSSSTALAPPQHHHDRRRQNDNVSNTLLIPKHSSSFSPVSFDHLSKTQTKISSLLRSFLSLISFPATIITLPASCKWLAISSHLSVTHSLGRKVTGTLFGNRRGHVSFAVQLDPRSEPVLLLELAMSTSSLVKEMSSGLVRIALESERHQCSGRGGRKPLFHEPTWTMYCNGRKLGCAASRTCGEFDWHVLSTVRSVSVGAGVIPVVDDGQKGSSEGLGELLYMRARFERVVGSRDSEAFYMLNPDGSNGGPELSIFLLRI